MSVSFIVPCFNEEKNIVKTINSIVYATKKLKIKNQIIIVNDGSTDRTNEILLKFKKSKKIKILRNKVNSGLGFSFNKALKNAEHKWVMMIPGDNDIKSKYIIKFIKKKDDNKLIVGYMKNMKEKRSLFRTIVSNLFTLMSNFIFNKKFKYYIGIQLHNKNYLKQIKISYKNYLYQPEIFIKTINKYKILEYVDFVPNNREYGKSKLFNFKNYFELINFFIKFFYFRFVKIESKIL